MTTGTDIPPTLTLQEKVAERIRSQIGELLDADDLKRLVDRAIDEAFFKERVARRSEYGTSHVEPPLIVTTIAALLKPQVEEQVGAWMCGHGDEVRKQIEAVVREGLVAVVARVISDRMQTDLWTFGSALAQRMTGKPL